MAWEISGGDWDFIYTLDQENGLWNPHRQSDVYSYYDTVNKRNVICRKGNWDSRCKREPSFGFCQLHTQRHSDVINDPRFWDNHRWQLEQCREKYKGGTRFYGYDVRHRVKDRFTKL